VTRLRRQTWISIGVLLALALLLRFNVRQGRVSGPSMSPTYEDGNTVLVWTSAPRSNLKPGDVIIFRDTNGDELIKRIAFIRPVWRPAPPVGDFRTINGNRRVPYPLLFGWYFQSVMSGKTPVPSPDRTIYVLGDNLLQSDDSRHIGPISPRQILGKVVP
jgi:signal peptidase I